MILLYMATLKNVLVKIASELFMHTPAFFFFKNLIPLIGNTLNKFFNNDIINLKQNSKFFNCSNSYTATITKEIMMTVNDSTEVKLT